ncbi:ADP-ribose glycohydrolase OARD1 isoform X1 [Macrotis lagotis]|uniref:ADP-ribose glycohydrolase OARD1 isoform X1 n=1 Tax=Macrotis lagotis TaxID=92651 RepID=UPI003D688651
MAPCRPRPGAAGAPRQGHPTPRAASRRARPAGSAAATAATAATRPAPRARRAPGPLLSGQRDPPIGALGPALGRWILAPHTHRASLPRFAARADWLQYRTPKPNQRLQPPLPPPLPLPGKMANANKGAPGPPSNRLGAGAYVLRSDPDLAQTKKRVKASNPGGSLKFRLDVVGRRT